MTHHDDSDCTGCPIAPNRRDFLRDFGRAAVAAALLAAGVSRSAAAELPIALTRALSHSGDTHLYAIPGGDGVQIDHDAEVILVRWQGALYAFDLSCPHQHTALRWDDTDQRFQCPKHKSRYAPDGAFISGRATRSMDRFALQRQAGNVVVDLSKLYKQPDDPAAWAAALVKL
jgi:nitrite reductase/ring-hydroxylating ferredoxin subunit